MASKLQGKSRPSRPTPPAQASRKSKIKDRAMLIAVCLGLVAAVWFIYGQTVHYDFVNYDDNDYVIDNAQVTRGLSLEGIAWAFSHVHSANWHPLTWISHMLDCQLYGVNPGAHHFTNVLLHSANAVLLFLLLRQMTGLLWPSAFVAAFFAVHPLRAESVAWISERKDLLSGLFFMLTLMAYVHYVRAPNRRRYLSVLLLFCLGLMSKPMLVSLPLVLLLLDYWPLNRLSTLTLTTAENRKAVAALVLEKLPLFFLVAASSVITIIAQRGALQPVTRIGIGARLGNAAIACVEYIGRMFWPKNLAALYPWDDSRLQVSYIAGAISLLAAVSILVFLLRRKRYLVTGWLWYLVMLLPVIGILQVGNQSSADRYTYLPLIGLYILIVWGSIELGARLPYWRIIFPSVAVMVLALLTLTARVQASSWRDGETLWSHALAATTQNIIAEGNLGDALYKKGKEREAWVHLERSLWINRHQPTLLSSVGAFYLATGQFEAARAHLEEALEMEPNLADAHYNLGNLYLQLGQASEAVTHYQRTLDVKPDDIQALNNMAWILATWPNPSFRNGIKAVTLAEHADSLTSNQNQTIAATLAAAYAEAGRFPEAIQAAERAIRLASAEGNEARVASIRAQLDNYKLGIAFRDTRYQDR